MVTWSASVDVIFGGDLVAALGYRTPAGGVVVQAVAPVGLRDRERGTLGFTTSLGFSKKLERIAADPRVGLAFHTRRHGTASTNDYALAQGTAQVVEQPSTAERERVGAAAAAHLGAPKRGVFWDRWLREYYQVRVPVNVGVERLIIWSELDAAGRPKVSGEPLPDRAPEPQRVPRNGTAPRIEVARAARRLRATEHTLLGFAGADGAPMVVPVAIGRDEPGGIWLTSAVELPPGGRRAGLLGHSFKPRTDRARGASTHRLDGRRGRSQYPLRTPHRDRLQGAGEQDTAAASQRRSCEAGREEGTQSRRSRGHMNPDREVRDDRVLRATHWAALVVFAILVPPSSCCGERQATPPNDGRGRSNRISRRSSSDRVTPPARSSSGGHSAPVSGTHHRLVCSEHQRSRG